MIAAVDSEEVAVRRDQAPGAAVDLVKVLANPDVVEIRSVEVVGAAGTKRWRELQMTGPEPAKLAGRWCRRSEMEGCTVDVVP